MFRPVGCHETKPASEETIFRMGEDIPKPALVTPVTTKRRAAKANDRGQS